MLHASLVGRMFSAPALAFYNPRTFRGTKRATLTPQNVVDVLRRALPKDATVMCAPQGGSAMAAVGVASATGESEGGGSPAPQVVSSTSSSATGLNTAVGASSLAGSPLLVCRNNRVYGRFAVPACFTPIPPRETAGVGGGWAVPSFLDLVQSRISTFETTEAEAGGPRQCVHSGSWLLICRERAVATCVMSRFGEIDLAAATTKTFFCDATHDGESTQSSETPVALFRPTDQSPFFAEFFGHLAAHGDAYEPCAAWLFRRDDRRILWDQVRAMKRRFEAAENALLRGSDDDEDVQNQETAHRHTGADGVLRRPSHVALLDSPKWTSLPQALIGEDIVAGMARRNGGGIRQGSNRQRPLLDHQGVDLAACARALSHGFVEML